MSNNKLSTSNVNTINTIFTFTNMKNSLNSPHSESPNIPPSSYSSDISVGSISNKEMVISPSSGMNYSNSMTSNATSVMNTYTSSMKSSIPESQSIPSSYLKNKTKYNYSNLNSIPIICTLLLINLIYLRQKYLYQQLQNLVLFLVNNPIIL